MNNTTISIIVLIIMVILSAAVLVLFTRNMKGRIQEASNADGEGDDRVYKTDNALEFTKWLHQNPTEIGIEERYIQSDGVVFRVSFNGNLFGKPAHGTVLFEEDGGEIIKKARTIYIYSSELSYEECRDKLSRIYGKVKDEGEEPFAEGAGGSIMHCEFSGRGVNVKLTKASERDYLEVVIQ